jgi:hypothetical protein
MKSECETEWNKWLVEEKICLDNNSKGCSATINWKKFELKDGEIKEVMFGNTVSGYKNKLTCDNWKMNSNFISCIDSKKYLSARKGECVVKWEQKSLYSYAGTKEGDVKYSTPLWQKTNTVYVKWNDEVSIYLEAATDWFKSVFNNITVKNTCNITFSGNQDSLWILKQIGTLKAWVNNCEITVTDYIQTHTIKVVRK